MNINITPTQKLRELNHINKFLSQAVKLAERYAQEGKIETGKAILSITSKVAETRMYFLPKFYCMCGAELKADNELENGRCFVCRGIN